MATDQETIVTLMNDMGQKARHAARQLASAPTAQKDEALRNMADQLIAQSAEILAANKEDIALATKNEKPAAFIDRLTLDQNAIHAIADGLNVIADLPDPIGEVIANWQRPNGLDISRVRTPLGVIGVIFESRPNVTADAGALCLKAGNAAILRCGSDSLQSSLAIAKALQDGLTRADLSPHSIQLVPNGDRACVGQMLTGLNKSIDVIVPRGGKSLVERVEKDARVPVFSHLEGICHMYIDQSADKKKAGELVLNAKLRRTGVCGALETLLIDQALDTAAQRDLITSLLEAGCEVRADEAIQALDSRVKAANDQDWDTEYLDAIIAVKLVDGVEGAVSHIARHSSHHTEAIVAEDSQTAEQFLNQVDSAIVIWNASTQFADGGEFGMGAEIGIATGKMHARGPVGVEQLTSFKYQVRGNGQVRPR